MTWILRTKINLTHMTIHRMKVQNKDYKLICHQVMITCFSQLMKIRPVQWSYSINHNLNFTQKMLIQFQKQVFIVTTFLMNLKEGIMLTINVTILTKQKLNLSKLYIKSLWMLSHLRILKLPIKWSNQKINKLNLSEKYSKLLLSEFINKSCLKIPKISDLFITYTYFNSKINTTNNFTKSSLLTRYSLSVSKQILSIVKELLTSYKVSLYITLTCT